MYWFKIDKASTTIPQSGTYHEWKPLLAKEAKNQCVYCAIHEGSFGGERNFHVEHFKPKSRFRSHINNYYNLFYACAICNTFKGDEWPGTPGHNLSQIGFINPSVVDYSRIFQSNATSSRLVSRHKAARYMIEQLYLNRPQLILERRMVNAERTLIKEQARVEKSVQDWREAGAPSSASHLIQQAVSLLSDINRILVSIRRTAPYTPQDVRRPKKKTTKRS